jgi:septal ring factor EnvC (AmiA/AmiB activator)
MTGPQDYPPPDAPATVEDVRASRRWTYVAFAWAVAASIIAVLALIQANKSDNTGQPAPGADVASQLQSFEKQVNDQLTQFSQRLDQTASADDLAKIDKRLTSVEDDVAKLKTSSSDQNNTVTKMQSDLSDLSKRVDQLEKNQQSGGTGTGTGTSTTP